ncbi:MAG: hypothetical protein JWP81_1161 [Ferruginibacter sp.]|nr:hypothetical protein [Ferruginibacter sp.]
MRLKTHEEMHVENWFLKMQSVAGTLCGTFDKRSPA